jgi:type II secretory pathway pseudopilin PulG
MKKIIKAFTLVEMIVSVTISILLLWSLSIFMWNWIKNITFQKNNLEAFQKNSDIYYNLNKRIFWASNYKNSSSSWFIIKINRKNDKWGFAYIWEKNYHKTYCQTGNLDTNHLIIKTFVPFEYPWADFVAGTSYNHWWITTKFFNWTVSWWWISWEYLWPTDFITDWTVIIWKSWIFWNYFKEGINATEVLLNNPTW